MEEEIKPLQKPNKFPDFLIQFQSIATVSGVKAAAVAGL